LPAARECSVIRFLLRIRSHPGVQAAERAARRLPPIDRLARRAYARHKRRVLARVTRDPDVRSAVLGDRDLPAGFGVGMDERVVEYPWVLARIPPGPARVFDAGSTLNYEWVADHPALDGKSVVLFTLAPEGVLARRNFSYLYGDLRATMLQDASMDIVVCLSTLEHIGMDNRGYTGHDRDRDHDLDAWHPALLELRRILRPGGHLLLTVPFGRAQDLGWLQQFDREGLRAIRHAFDGIALECNYFLHRDGLGWQRASPDDCADATFLYRAPGGTSMATRATAVACMALERRAGPA
jgi:SAM-dependent methyltransferase